jgi:hypothetical protein
MKYDDKKYRKFRIGQLHDFVNTTLGIEVKDLRSVRRADRITFNSLDIKFDKYTDNLYAKYCNDLETYGEDYKDNIFDRYYFKEFTLKYKKDSITIYINFEITDDPKSSFDGKKYNNDEYKWDKDHKLLTITAYSSDTRFNLEYCILSCTMFLNDVKLVADAENKEDIQKIALSIKYQKDIPENMQVNTLLVGTREFLCLNYYMLNKVEDNESISIDEERDFNGTIVEYIKSKAHMDKRIKINLDKELSLRVDPKRRNIYSHDQKVIRRLCDYKFQVCGHWHSYWYGPRNKPEERHKEQRWVEAYFKNTDKEFNIIKDRYKETEAI